MRAVYDTAAMVTHDPPLHRRYNLPLPQACGRWRGGRGEERLDEAAKKQVLRLFSYGLYALAARSGDDVRAMTVNWAMQVSFDPPLVAVSIERESRTGALAIQTGQFALCVYAEGQRELAGQLGRHSAKVPEKFAGVPWEPAPVTGCPLIAGALGALECRIAETVAAGDSVLIVGAIIAAHSLTDGEPLTMRAAGFRHAG